MGWVELVSSLARARRKPASRFGCTASRQIPGCRDVVGTSVSRRVPGVAVTALAVPVTAPWGLLKRTVISYRRTRAREGAARDVSGPLPGARSSKSSPRPRDALEPGLSRFLSLGWGIVVDRVRADPRLQAFRTRRRSALRVRASVDRTRSTPPRRPDTGSSRSSTSPLVVLSVRPRPRLTSRTIPRSIRRPSTWASTRHLPGPMPARSPSDSNAGRARATAWPVLSATISKRALTTVSSVSDSRRSHPVSGRS